MKDHLEILECILGIDPGHSGAFAILDLKTGSVLKMGRMPVDSGGVIYKNRTKVNIRKLWDAIAPYERCIRCTILERVHSMPKQGVASTFTFGRSFGALEGLLEGHAMRITYAEPSVWKSIFNLSRDKQDSLNLAKKLWPEIKGHFERKNDDGLAEACLLAEYGRRMTVQSIDNHQDINQIL